ncbi:hypothetical protein HZF08_14880 [Paenibacillus sp. CGMCC 1.16610]|uniref:Gfo/Idh/MocA-like oxidoreductase N-terminal domain-containing protein n=1 Tax=Paenibacillus anseongense TaxID=2682845 RepID=A0ABW9UJ46_9BACL|nr:hypothetical protein [Paenibacillus sp. CGMCC 1.16610]MVQ39260.1 hypothetical protein [Paenibacillus anseongense]
MFCEKPIALSLADCEDMIEACRRASVPPWKNVMRRYFQR